MIYLEFALILWQYHIIVKRLSKTNSFKACLELDRACLKVKFYKTLNFLVPQPIYFVPLPGHVPAVEKCWCTVLSSYKLFKLKIVDYG